MRTKRAVASLSGLKAVDAAQTTFEMIVSVFGNVDYAGDRVMPGAFLGSLTRWAAAGDLIPVIWSHEWQDPFAHIGAVTDAAERPGGLWTRWRLDVDVNPTAAQVARLLSERRVREASFAYDVLDERRGSDGVNELVELDLIEVGPTLKGANPETQLLAAGVKNRGAAAELDPKSALRWIDAFEAEGRRQKRLGFGEVDRAVASGRPSVVLAALKRLGV